MSRRITHWLALGTLAASLVLTSCGGASRTAARVQLVRATPTAFPTATATPTVSLPVFSDWRIAYLDDDGVLHALSLDGKTDLQGPGLGFGARAVTISPDGHTIAYLTHPTWGPVTLTHLVAPTTTVVSLVNATYLASPEWSPDGSRLAVPGTVSGVTSLYLIDAQTGAATPVPQTGLGEASSFAGFEAAIIGWVDQSRLVISGGGRGPQVLDVTTGVTTPIAIPDPLTLASIVPDGRQVLLTGTCTGCCAPVKDVAVLDLATGAVRHLPTITAATNGYLPSLWRPGTTVAAGTAYPGDSNRTALALFDVSSDQVTPLVLHEVPVGWTPDGKTLLAARTPAGENDPLYAVNPEAPTEQTAPLPASIHQLIGFVRTSDGPAQGMVAPLALTVTAPGEPLVGARGVAHQSRWLWAASSC